MSGVLKFHEGGTCRNAVLKKDTALLLLAVDFDDQLGFAGCDGDAAAQDTVVRADLGQGETVTASYQPAVNCG